MHSSAHLRLAQDEQFAKHVTIHAHPYFSQAIQHGSGAWWPAIIEEIVEIVKVVFQERIAERICEQIVDVEGSQVAETELHSVQWNRFSMIPCRR